MSHVLRIAYALLAALAATAFTACGGGNDRSTASTATARSGALPALATRPPAKGEIVVRGDISPATHGPYTFRGRYVVRFEQYAPENPALDFSGQTPFAVTLQRRAGDVRGAIGLFVAARRSGREVLVIRGHYVVDVSFGDFPYVIRFTPRA
jgi:hypothetical protein